MVFGRTEWVVPGEGGREIVNASHARSAEGFLCGHEGHSSKQAADVEDAKRFEQVREAK